MINSTLYQSGSPDLVVKGEDSYQKAMSSNPSTGYKMNVSN